MLLAMYKVSRFISALLEKHSDRQWSDLDLPDSITIVQVTQLTVPYEAGIIYEFTKHVGGWYTHCEKKEKSAITSMSFRMRIRRNIKESESDTADRPLGQP